MSRLLFRAVLLWLAAVNVAAFLLYGVDKRRARRRDWRIPERTLLAVSFAGGWLGAGLGMWLWHHKTRKRRFQILVPLSALLWLAALWLSVRWAL